MINKRVITQNTIDENIASKSEKSTIITYLFEMSKTYGNLYQ